MTAHDNKCPVTLSYHARNWTVLAHLSCIDMQASSQLYMDAINILADQDEGKEGLSGDLFRQAIGMHNPLALACGASCDVLGRGLEPCKGWNTATLVVCCKSA